MQILALIERIDSKNEDPTLLDIPQFKITEFRKYTFIDKILHKIRVWFEFKRVTVIPSVFNISFRYNTTGICSLDVIPGKRIQHEIWRKAKESLDKTPPLERYYRGYLGEDYNHVKINKRFKD